MEIFEKTNTTPEDAPEPLEEQSPLLEQKRRVQGVGVGAFAGYYGGIVDSLLMRITDTILSIPLYLLLFVLSASFTDGSPISVIFLIAIFGWTTAARLIRSEFLAQKEREYVRA